MVLISGVSSYDHPLCQRMLRPPDDGKGLSCRPDRLIVVLFSPPPPLRSSCCRRSLPHFLPRPHLLLPFLLMHPPPFTRVLVCIVACNVLEVPCRLFVTLFYVFLLSTTMQLPDFASRSTVRSTQYCRESVVSLAKKLTVECCVGAL